MDERGRTAAVFAGIGVLTLLGGALFAYSQLTFYGGSTSLRGTVVDVVWDSVTDDEGTHLYAYPVFEFIEPSSGSVIRALGRVGSNPPDYQIGDSREILFNPSQPRYVLVNSFWDFWTGPVIALILGGAFILSSIVISHAPADRFS